MNYMPQETHLIRLVGVETEMSRLVDMLRTWVNLQHQDGGLFRSLSPPDRIDDSWLLLAKPGQVYFLKATSSSTCFVEKYLAQKTVSLSAVPGV